MKIAVTISDCRQVSQEQFRDENITKIFESSASINDMLSWAKTINKKCNFHSLAMSVVEEDQTKTKVSILKSEVFKDVSKSAIDIRPPYSGFPFRLCDLHRCYAAFVRYKEGWVILKLRRYFEDFGISRIDERDVYDGDTINHIINSLKKKYDVEIHSPDKKYL